ncbi:MAG: hypothetical protein JNM65_10055 [Verrucomicrobiaceae bacterium]|nr:hypothetical protein [Verrucomicrobiaceae bacterium]
MKRHPLDKPEMAQVFAIQFKLGLWAFIRITRNRRWGVWNVYSTTAAMPKVEPRPEKWFFCGIVDKGDTTELVYLGICPFATEDESWPPPSHEIFRDENPYTLVFYRGASRYVTRAQVEAEGIAQVMRGTLQDLIAKLNEFHDAGLLRLVDPAPAGTTALIPPHLKDEKLKKKAKPATSRGRAASAQVKFDADGNDRTTFAPFVLQDCGEEVRLMFSDWDWLRKKCGGDSIGDYYLNGPGVEGLVMATRRMNGLTPDPDTMDPNSEGDACYIHFTDFDEAVQTASLCKQMIQDLKLIRKAAKIAEENGYGD